VDLGKRVTFLWSPDFNGQRRDMKRNLQYSTRIISEMKLSKTRDITHKVCVYELATSFNRRPVSAVATVMLPIQLLV
jgi:hypothetical protein